MSEYTREDELRDRDDARGCRWCGGKGYIPHPGEPYACDPCDCKTAGEEDERTFVELVEEGLATWEPGRDEAQKAAIKVALAGETMLAALKDAIATLRVAEAYMGPSSGGLPCILASRKLLTDAIKLATDPTP